MHLRTAVSLGIAFVMLAAASRAELICYDGFGYAPATSINGLSGSGDAGFASAWSYAGGVGKARIAAPGLSYASPPGPATTLFTNANRVARSNLGYTIAERAIDVTPFAHLLDGNGNLGKGGTTNWFAVVFRSDAGVAGNSFSVVLGNSNDNANPDKQHNLAMGSIVTSTNVWHFNQHNRAAGYSAVPIVAGQAVLLVSKLVFGPDGGTGDSAFLWVNPPLDAEPAEGTADATMTALNDIYYKKILMYGPINDSVTGSVDEVRVGETWQDVVPTGASAKPDTPVNESPLDGATGVSLTPPLMAAAFANAGAPWDAHHASQFSVVSLDGAFWGVVTGALTTVAVPSGTLRPSTRYTWRVRYQGTNNNQWSGWSSATRFETAGDGAPTLVCYDGAAYAPTAQGVQNLAGGIGWAAPWERVGVIDHWTVVAADSPGLLYQFSAPAEYLAVTNNRFMTTKNGLHFDSVTPFDAALSRVTRQAGVDGAAHLLTTNNAFGKTGTTNWFSFLARYEEGDTAGRFGLDFNLVFSHNDPNLFFIGKPANASTYGLMAPASPDPLMATSSVSAVDGATALLVTRLIHGASSATAHLWVNPASRVEPSAGAAGAVLSGITPFQFRYLGIVARGATLAPSAGIDELRFGDTWDTVMPAGPAPPPDVGTPTNITPADGAVNVALTPTLEASSFVGSGSGDVHSNTEVRIRSLDGVESVLVTSGLAAVTLPAGILEPSTRYAWRVRYLGINNPAWSEYSGETWFDTVHAAAGVIAYDSAEYPVLTNGINGRAGGQGWLGGWVWTWFGVSPGYETRVNVSAPGLGYTDPAFGPLSNRFVTHDAAYDDQGGTAPATQSRAYRRIKRDGAMHLLTANNEYGAAGTTNWLAFLARYESGDASARFGVELTPLAADLPAHTFFVGKPAGAGTTWGMVATNGATITSNVEATGGATALLVARLAHGASDTEASLWVNPVLAATPPVPEATLAGVPPFTFSYLAIAASKQGGTVPIVSIDEIRFGDTWEAVTQPIPEPAAMAVCAGLLALVSARRRA